jgi:hypothetical protein
MQRPISASSVDSTNIASLHWHVFGFAEGGFADIIFYYDQVDNIRPEDVGKD